MKAVLRKKCLQCLTLFLIAVSTPMGYAQGGDGAGRRETSDSNRFELDEIVVTATRFEAPVKSVPRNVTIITREDIEQAPSNNIVDLLDREAGIHISSLFGNDKQAVVDVRGMGATATSNVVVMVDGIKLNPADMSGVDFSSIQLEQVDRIEIIRGAGSVVYGDGAVGGVINIVTRKGQLETERRVSGSYGSFATTDLRTSVTGSMSDLSYNVSAGYFDSEGYRDNGEFEKKDIAGVVQYYMTGVTSFHVSGAYHEDAYGLPGPVSRDALDDAADRVKTLFPDDYGETTEMRVSGGIEFDTDTTGVIKVVRGYRLRNNDFVVGYSPLIPKEDQISEIEEFNKTLNITYDLDFDFLQRNHKLQIGVDHAFADYVREESPGGPRVNSRTTRFGVFVNNQWSLADPLLFQWGYRENQFNGKFRTDQLVSVDGAARWVNGETDKSAWRNRAYDLGLIWFYSDRVSFFSNVGTNFRIPNVDEFAESEPGLKPQKGTAWEAGTRYRVPDRLEVTLTVFHMETEDEIYYSEINRNYPDTTIREGIETDIRFYWNEAVYLWGNYSYMEATFEGNGNDIPLVPRHKGSAGIQWTVADGLNVSLTGTFSGARYDGNDMENDRYAQLDAYSVFDGKLTYRHGNLKWSAGINNMFDTFYATYAYSEQYYPMPGRNVYAGVEWMF